MFGGGVWGIWGFEGGVSLKVPSSSFRCFQLSCS